MKNLFLLSLLFLAGCGTQMNRKTTSDTTITVGWYRKGENDNKVYKSRNVNVKFKDASGEKTSNILRKFFRTQQQRKAKNYHGKGAGR